MSSFEALVETHRATLRLHCYRMLGSSHDRDDMVQETFVRAFRAQHTLQDPATARAWLYRIATNVWEKGDLDAIIALLHDDVTLSMPPNPTWIAGRADVARFYTNRLTQAVREHRFRTAIIDANGRPSAGFYRLGDDGVGTFFALQVIEAKEGRIRVIDHFMTASSHAVFFAGGLARTTAGTRGD